MYSAFLFQSICSFLSWYLNIFWVYIDLLMKNEQQFETRVQRRDTNSRIPIKSIIFYNWCKVPNQRTKRNQWWRCINKSPINDSSIIGFNCISLIFYPSFTKILRKMFVNSIWDSKTLDYHLVEYWVLNTSTLTLNCLDIFWYIYGCNRSHRILFWIDIQQCFFDSSTTWIHDDTNEACIQKIWDSYHIIWSI